MQGSWADDSQEDNTPTPISGALKHLVNNGLRFKRAPFWSSSARPKLEKSLSFYFSADTVVTSQEILEAFDKARIEIDDIPSIQRETSNRTWVVSFDSQLAKEPLEKLRQGTTVFMGDCENRLVLFKIYEAPAELPDTAFIGQRSYYGRVSSFRRNKIAQFIDGVRTARMSLNGIWTTRPKDNSPQTIRPQSLDNSPQVSGRFAPNLWTIRPCPPNLLTLSV